ncbi:MAG: DUF305 domain-containing protein [Gemmatimonadetes bacterium]|nr:DUF305 domain-containing protein [Gemmatimonadota bacterium]
MDPLGESPQPRPGPGTRAWCVAVALLAWGASACAGVATPGSVGAPPPNAAELEALYLARQDSARTRFTEADARFVTDMIAHHAQAVVMSELAPARAADPSIRTLAARIINAQHDEVAWMELWLRDRGQAVPSADGEHAHLHMPGMASSEQLAALQRTTGEAFDRLFLTLMIEHHRGAIAMVNALLATDGAAQDPATFKLASDINVDQTTEIARMELMLDALSSGDTR